MAEHSDKHPDGSDKPNAAVKISIGPEIWLSERRFKVAVSGVSMLPSLLEGDMIEVVQVSPDDLQMGDLIVFERNGELTVHRFLIRRGNLFLEKGDAQAMGNWHPWPENLGKVIRVKHTGEWLNLLSDSLSRKLGRLNLIRHRINAVANKIPTTLGRRICLRLARPLIKSRPEENLEVKTNNSSIVQKLHTKGGTNDKNSYSR